MYIFSVVFFDFACMLVMVERAMITVKSTDMA